MNYHLTLLSTAMAAALLLPGAAQAKAPEVFLLSPGNTTFASALSPSGQYVVAPVPADSEESGTPQVSKNTVIDITDPNNMIKYPVTPASAASAWTEIRHVNDDGMCFGCDGGKPGVYNPFTGQWTMMDLPEELITSSMEWVSIPHGIILHATPDGKTAVGYVNDGTEAHAFPAMWDVETGKFTDLRTLRGFPKKDMCYLDIDENVVFKISPDGRYLVGQLSNSILVNWEDESAHPYGGSEILGYVYDRETDTWNSMAFIVDDDTRKWEMRFDGVYFLDWLNMSHNGQYVAGGAYMVHPVSGSDLTEEYRAGYLYDITTDAFSVFDNLTTDQDVAATVVANDGHVYGKSPADGNPWPSGVVRVGNFWVTFEDILSQVYGVNIGSKVGMTQSNSPEFMSADERTFVMTSSQDGCYVIKAYEDLAEAARQVNLLLEYQPEYANGSVMGQLKTFKIKFNRAIEFDAANASKIKVTKDGADLATAIGGTGVTSGDPSSLTIGLRTRQLAENSRYQVIIPAGVIKLAGANEGDFENIYNEKITLTYYGRTAGPLVMASANPANNADVEMLTSANPVTLRFNEQVKLTDTAAANLYITSQDNINVAKLLVAVSSTNSKLVTLTPMLDVKLYDGETYQLVVDAGSFTDITGLSSSKNEEIVLNYNGVYIKPVSDEKILFESQSNNYNEIMLYDGDQLTPEGDAADWGFTSEVPWLPTRSSEDTSDWAFTAHCMYTEDGFADDWMVIEQLMIPNDDCFLNFDAQSYRNPRIYDDNLEVYVWATDAKYNVLSEDIINRLKENATLVFNEKLDWGGTAGSLEDEWTNYTVLLDQYAGQKIYIAFHYAGEVGYGSAVFVDNIIVQQNQKFDVDFLTVSNLTAQDDVQVSLTVQNAQPATTYNTIVAKLYDSADNLISTYTASDLGLEPGKGVKVVFDDRLPLTAGVRNYYKVDITMDDDNAVFEHSVLNMMFQTTRRVPIEEFSGSACQNCPLGFIAFEQLHSMYGDQFIPIAVRTYQEDHLSTGVTGYSSFLGLTSLGAPSGYINREYKTYPAVSTVNDGGGYTYHTVGSSVGAFLWIDAVAEVMKESAECDLEATMYLDYDYADKEAYINFEYKPTFAVSSTGRAINAFGVLLENNMTTYQSNGFSTSTDPFFGDWAANGKYGMSTVAPYYIDHVARYTVGQTYNGTRFKETTIEAGREYTDHLGTEVPKTQIVDKNNIYGVVMLIDTNTGKVLNACVAPVAEGTGIQNVVVDSEAANCQIVANGSIVNVTANEAVNVEAYSVAGALLGKSYGADGTVALDLNGYHGIAIVSATTANGNTVRKLVVR